MIDFAIFNFKFTHRYCRGCSLSKRVICNIVDVKLFLMFYSRWMNKIGLASLHDFDISYSKTTAGFVKPDKSIYGTF